MKTDAKQSVTNAWLREGKSPAYHKKIKLQLRAMWPTLYYSIEQLVHESQTKR